MRVKITREKFIKLASIWSSVIGIFFVLLFTTNTSSIHDELGCRVHKKSGLYKCEVGELSGRVFSSKKQAVTELAKRKSIKKQSVAISPESTSSDNRIKDVGRKLKQVGRNPASVPSRLTVGEANTRLIVMSWSADAFSGGDSDYDRASIVMNDADVIVLQGIETVANGSGFLNVIASLMEAKGGDKVCRAWVQSQSGVRQPYGYLWKSRTVGWINETGEMLEGCGSSAYTIRLTKKARVGGHALFFARQSRRLFALSTVSFDTKPKTFVKDYANFFRSVIVGPWPVVAATDFKVSSRDSVFNDIREDGFQFAIRSRSKIGRRSDENFWFKRGASLSAGTINLYQRFKDARPEDIERSFSSIFPIAMEISLTESTADEMTSVLMSKGLSNGGIEAAQNVVSRPSRSKKVGKKLKDQSEVGSLDEAEDNLEDEESLAEKSMVGQ